MLKIIISSIAVVAATFAPIKVSDDSKGLKDHYQNYFPIGVAITPQQLRDPAQRDLILKHFNSLTAENAMKMGPLHPEEGRYFWRDADSIVAFTQRHGLKLRGHNLCWHTQAPKWMFTDAQGIEVSKEVLLKRLKDHIQTVVSRYKGKIYAWDVVNEAIADERDRELRESPWSKICGEDFIFEAFKYAHEADPDAVLFYNDYNTEQPGKRQKIYNLLKRMKDAGIPVHGVGLQAHWSLRGPSQAEIEKSIELFASLGLKVQITELDVSIFDDNKPDTLGFTPEREQQLADRYKMMFEVFRKHKQDITGVTFWNLSDKSTWLDNFPVRGRKNYPLLFDTQLQPKKAYRSVVDF
ncbi:endo-1,4-beta-xylanase [Mucilaginibacter myungsuensis]|uniref:Beta-xylanase n=1 Tax=Mucilaginibacter myungsuensis TaxID=649104 RepID=A0A929PVY6_9SPHI|nr:endo-1,4-beta-xylanase [Mucilaginibacter myungsuensis]MBE9661609.1 endo-1,4-beta-xylanase [Mucilaginibacter myungsuensis]MDN3597754.1 endo-1,4-beta-xylanase [Mucilaginibacter myungsuensis]